MLVPPTWPLPPRRDSALGASVSNSENDFLYKIGDKNDWDDRTSHTGKEVEHSLFDIYTSRNKTRYHKKRGKKAEPKKTFQTQEKRKSKERKDSIYTSSLTVLT